MRAWQAKLGSLRARMPPAPKPPPVPPRPAIAPRPVSAKGAPVRYLTDEQKAALNAKYGQLQKPTAKDVEAIAQSGCKTQ